MRLADFVIKFLEEKKIDTVFTHWFGDINTDHKATWDISRTAFRNVKNFFMYQSNSYGDNVSIFKPNFYSTFNKDEYSFKEKLYFFSYEQKSKNHCTFCNFTFVYSRYDDRLFLRC